LSCLSLCLLLCAGSDFLCQMEGTETEITVGPEATSIASTVPKDKPAPKNGKLPVRFVYHPSPDGVDENLLIMLHGLGSFPDIYIRGPV